MLDADARPSALADDDRQSSAGPALRVDDVAHQYGQRWALRGVSFTVAQGEIFALLGPNGGGKTTLFRILSTVLAPTRGSAAILGIPLHAVRRVREQLGVVFQQPALDVKLTVWENLISHAHLHGLRGADVSQRALQLLERFGIADRRKELAERLSGGLQRRVELAKCLLHRPRVLLLDEPSTGLDPGARREFFALLQELRSRDGLTVVLTTHFMEEADRCDRVGILHQGQLVALGTPAELKGEVGGDVLVIHAENAEQVRREIEQVFGLSARVVDGSVRIEHPEAEEWVARLVKHFGDAITLISYGRPTLEDVFIHHTGQRFWAGESRE
jgi:ABC-2 type transport system ATP-binding protein